MNKAKDMAMKKPRRWPWPEHPIAEPAMSTGPSDGDSSLGAHALSLEETPRTGLLHWGKRKEVADGGCSPMARVPYGNVAREHHCSVGSRRATSMVLGSGSGLGRGELHRGQPSRSIIPQSDYRGTDYPSGPGRVPRAHCSYRSRSVAAYALRGTSADFCLLTLIEGLY